MRGSLSEAGTRLDAAKFLWGILFYVPRLAGGCGQRDNGLPTRGAHRHRLTEDYKGIIVNARKRLWSMQLT